MIIIIVEFSPFPYSDLLLPTPQPPVLSVQGAILESSDSSYVTDLTRKSVLRF